ncbi:hypothetical protein D3C72_1494630 [compost metagenome]
MTIAVIYTLEVIEVEDRHQQMTAVFLPLQHLLIHPLGPGSPIGQACKRVDQGLLALLFKVFAIAHGFLLHARYTFGQTLQAAGHVLLTLITLVLMLVHGAEQAFQAVFQNMLEAVKVGSTLNTALQAINLFTELVIQIAGGTRVVGMTFAGLMQMTLERLKSFVELLQICFKLVLTTVVDCQHEYRQVIQHRQQFVPVQTMF